ncbi:MAG: SIS domain-containing protein [bacterium]|nr:SIS domain-containing protein [bacterium]
MDIREFSKNYINSIKKAIDVLDLDKIEQVAQIIFNAYKNNKQIFIIGNGGSASTASHFACDLGKGTISDFKSKTKRFKVFSLTDNVATLMAFGNDLSFEEIFSEQLKNLVNPGDVVIVISASGNSQNLINGVECARDLGAKTIGLLGFKTGGKLADLVDCYIIAQDEHYGRSEDIHMIIVHMITNYFYGWIKQFPQNL